MAVEEECNLCGEPFKIRDKLYVTGGATYERFLDDPNEDTIIDTCGEELYTVACEGCGAKISDAVCKLHLPGIPSPPEPLGEVEALKKMLTDFSNACIDVSYDCGLALKGTWNRSDEGFEAIQEKLDALIEKAEPLLKG